MDRFEPKILLDEPYLELAEAVNDFLNRAISAQAYIPDVFLSNGKCISYTELQLMSVAELINGMNDLLGSKNIKKYANQEVTAEELRNISLYAWNLCNGKDVAKTKKQPIRVVNRLCQIYPGIELIVKLDEPHIWITKYFQRLQEQERRYNKTISSDFLFDEDKSILDAEKITIRQGIKIIMRFSNSHENINSTLKKLGLVEVDLDSFSIHPDGIPRRSEISCDDFTSVTRAVSEMSISFRLNEEFGPLTKIALQHGYSKSTFSALETLQFLCQRAEAQGFSRSDFGSFLGKENIFKNIYNGKAKTMHRNDLFIAIVYFARLEKPVPNSQNDNEQFDQPVPRLTHFNCSPTLDDWLYACGLEIVATIEETRVPKTKGAQAHAGNSSKGKIAVHERQRAAINQALDERFNLG